MSTDLRILDAKDAFKSIPPHRVEAIIYRFNTSIERGCQGQENLKEKVKNCCFSEAFSFDIKELGCLQKIVAKFKKYEVAPLFIERLQAAIDPIFHGGTSMIDYLSPKVFMHLLPFLTIKEVKKLSVVNSRLKALINTFPKEIKELDFISTVNSGRAIFPSFDALQEAIKPIADRITHIDLSKLLSKTKYADLKFVDWLEMEKEERDQIAQEVSEYQNKVIKKDDKFLNFLIKDCKNLTHLNIHFYILEGGSGNIFNLFPKLVNFKTASSESINLNRLSGSRSSWKL